MRLPSFDVDDETGRDHKEYAARHCGGNLELWLAIVARKARGQDYDYAVEQERKWTEKLRRRTE